MNKEQKLKQQIKTLNKKSEDLFTKFVKNNPEYMIRGSDDFLFDFMYNDNKYKTFKGYLFSRYGFTK